jgi:coenzyme F420-reducing hydrogenase beta subunit
LKFENGKDKVVEDYVTKVFVCNKGNYIEDCKTCNMHTAGNSYADLTIGDFWDYGKYKYICNEEFHPTKGSNIVYVNTEKGRTLFNILKY